MLRWRGCGRTDEVPSRALLGPPQVSTSTRSPEPRSYSAAWCATTVPTSSSRGPHFPTAWRSSHECRQQTDGRKRWRIRSSTILPPFATKPASVRGLRRLSSLGTRSRVNASAAERLAERIAGQTRVALYRRAMSALMPAVRETADRIATDALDALLAESRRLLLGSQPSV